MQLTFSLERTANFNSSNTYRSKTFIISLLLNISSDGYRLFLKYVIRRNFSEQEIYHSDTLPRAPIYQESVLDDWFHVCFIISYHYRTTGEMP